MVEPYEFGALQYDGDWRMGFDIHYVICNAGLDMCCLHNIPLK